MWIIVLKSPHVWRIKKKAVTLRRNNKNTMDMVQMTREEALRRWHSALRTKREAVEQGTKILVEEFERKYGEKPKYIEVW